MPDTGASRKRQIQVTSGPFSVATASGAAVAPIAQGLRRFSRDFSRDFAVSNAVAAFSI